MPESRKNPPESKEPFVSKEDRPEVQISLDTPLSELRVRDLSSILVSMVGKDPFEAGKTPSKTLNDEVGKPQLKDAKIEKYEKNEFKDKVEGKDKQDKIEKYEKNEKWETKNEKLEVEAVFPGRTPIPDPRLEKLIETVAGLTKQVSQLANQLEELKKKG